MTPRVAAIIAVAALIVSSCGEAEGGGDGAAPSLITTTSATVTATSLAPDPTVVETTARAAAPAPALVEQVDCPDHLGRSDGLQLACGVATVPIDRSDASVGSTVITIATLGGYDADFGTPLAVLQGGPGGASSELGAWFPQQAFTQVFVDQRGTGFLGPDFDCPEILDAFGRVLASGSAEAGVIADAAYDDCARRLSAEVVLQHTDSESHAADVVDVMAGLGYEQWLVYGVSYGSTLALEILRDGPPEVTGVVLDGVYPPDLDADAALAYSAERAVDAIDTACSSDSTCRGFLPDGSFRSTLERVMGDFDASPMIVTVAASELGLPADVDVVLDGRRVAELSFLLMYHESLLRHLPAVIGGLDSRDAASARWLVTTGSRLLVSSQNANDEGTYFAVQCHDRLPFTDGPGADPPLFGGAIVADGLDEFCEEWDREPAPVEADQPVAGTLPALLLSGSFDPITPPEYAVRVGERLATSTVVEQEGRGHGIWYGSACIAQIVQSFVEDPGRTPDTSCADEPVPVKWARP